MNNGLEGRDAGFGGTSPDPLSRYALQSISSIAKKTLKSSTITDDQSIELSHYLINVMFVLYSYDSNYRTTNIICLFFLDIFNHFKIENSKVKPNIARVFFEQATNHIKTKIDNNINLNVEEWNLILVLGEIWEYEKINQNTLIYWLEKSKKHHSDDFCYFSIITIIYYASNHAEYHFLQKSYCDKFSEYFSSKFNPICSHDVILVLDLMSCPWIGVDYKKQWAKAIHRKVDSKIGDQKLNFNSKKFLDFTSKRIWFMDWRAKNKLFEFLKKAEQKSPY